MVRLSAFICSFSLLLAVSCAEVSELPEDSPPEPVDFGGVVDASTLDMKVMFEYRGYFGCPGDETGLGDWLGWFESDPPGTDSAAVAYLPDVSDLSAGELCPTDMELADGSRAHVFSSANRRTVDRHFGWMASYGLDGVFLRRSVDELEAARLLDFRDRVAGNVMAAAETHGRVFAVMYDLIGATPAAVESDWSYVVDQLRLTGSDRYLHHEGRPVLGIDASGLAREQSGAQDVLEMVSHLREALSGAQEPALFAVVPAQWQMLGGETWTELVGAVDYISPWSVGEYDSEEEAAEFSDVALASGAADADAADTGYAPVVWPGLSGDAGAHLNAVPRDGGRFYWRQVYEAVSAGADALYIASFDGMDDGTAMFKLAPAMGVLPVSGNMLSLDVDGYDLPSDWFLRLGGESGRLIRREIPLSAALPIPPNRLPDAARNRIEMTFSTTSGRASVDISTPGNILTVRLVGTSGEPAETVASADGLVLSRGPAGSEDGRRIAMTVEYTVDGAALRGPMELRLEKGPLGSSELRVVRLTPRGAQVMRHVSHSKTPNLLAGEGLTVVIPWVGE